MNWRAANGSFGTMTSYDFSRDIVNLFHQVAVVVVRFKVIIMFSSHGLAQQDLGLHGQKFNYHFEGTKTSFSWASSVCLW